MFLLRPLNTSQSALKKRRKKVLVTALKYKSKHTKKCVSRCGLAVRRLAGKQKDLGSIRFGSPLSSLQKLWFMDTVL